MSKQVQQVDIRNHNWGFGIQNPYIYSQSSDYGPQLTDERYFDKHNVKYHSMVNR